MLTVNVQSQINAHTVNIMYDVPSINNANLSLKYEGIKKPSKAC